MKRFAANVDLLELLKEREAIYLLPNISIVKNHAAYTIDPATRYPASALKGLVPRVDVTTLYDDGIDPIQGVKQEQEVLVKELTPTHVASSQNSTSDNYDSYLSTKAQSSIVSNYKEDGTAHVHYPQ